MSAPKLVVRTHSPVRTWLVRAFAVLAALSAAWAVFIYGERHGEYMRAEALAERERLETEIAQLTAKNEILKADLARQGAAMDVDSVAYAEVETMLNDLNAEIAALNEELVFYRGIMSPSDGRSGLQIQSLELGAGADDRVYHLRLVLVQARRHTRRVQGSVQLAVHGVADSRPVIHPLGDLLPDDADTGKLVYSFRYFQNFERDLVLPANFDPERIQVTVTPKSGSGQFTRTFDWQIAES